MVAKPSPGGEGYMDGRQKNLESLMPSRFYGGRNRNRTCDPIDVNDVYHSGSFAWKNYGGFRHTSEPLSH